MWKCYFNKLAKQTHTSAWMFCCKYTAYFSSIFTTASDIFVKFSEQVTTGQLLRKFDDKI